MTANVNAAMASRRRLDWPNSYSFSFIRDPRPVPPEVAGSSSREIGISIGRILEDPANEATVPMRGESLQ